MRRVPPSMLIQEELDRLLSGGVDPGENLISRLVELATSLVVQTLVEGEQTDVLGGRGRYQPRDPEAGQRGSRNGYLDSSIQTAEGRVPVRVPQVRDADGPFRSTLLSFLEGNSEVLERLAMEMYARGMSTRDVEDAFRDATGEFLLSRSAVSEITDRLWTQYEQFCSRNLSDVSVEYLFCDAIFESLRRYGAKEAVLVAWGVDSEGRKHLLHLAVGNKESEQAWTEFFRHMVNRGLRMPTSVTSDGAPGLINAINTVFGDSIRIRCWYHRLSNIRTKLPDEPAPEVMAEIRAIRDAPTLDAARTQADRVINHYRNKFPAAIACLEDDLEALLAIHRIPVRHRINVRTTNLAKRSFVEERRRSKVIPRFLDEKSAMKLVFATLIRCSQRWQRISINDLE
ncbi:MAG TPA: IS256 family transposase, partial [Acidimicrobiia bacterium]|nr:IS256 family transposase [Acidimicrobiia bacterium]